MKKYKSYLNRVDLVKNQVEREELREQEAKRKRSRSIQEQNRQRWLKYQEQLRSELAARYFHAVQSTGGDEVYTNTKSLNFDGTDDFVDCGDANNLSFGDGSNDSAFSISLWIKMEGGSAVRHRFVNKMGASGDDEYYMGTTGGGGLFLALHDASTGGRIMRFGPSLNAHLNSWIHLTVTYDGSSSSNGITGYLNGSLITTWFAANSGTYTAMENTTSPLLLGKTAHQAYKTEGKMDEIAIFNSELSATDITSIYNGDGTGLPGDLSEFSSLVSWWRFEEGSGTTATDSGTGGNNGTIDGATYSTDIPE